jgi:hypothetical protein
MRRMGWVMGLVVAIVLVATYITWTAGRVERLHLRAGNAARALDAHLVRRAAAAAVLAEEAGIPDLYVAARVALDAHPEEREAAENDLTHQLREAVVSPEDPAFGNVVLASRRVGLARQVHNEMVRDALAARNRPLVRLLGVARHHPRPAYFDVDDPNLKLGQT